MLHLHRAERADRLAEALGEILADPSGDPFVREVVAVATRGMERWLAQTLSGRLGISAGHRDGVCANVDFPFPRQLLGAAVATATGVDPEIDPWLPERMVWPLLETIESCAAEPWLVAVAAHLESSPGRRFARVRLIAGLFDAYAVRRPELLTQWAREPAAGDGWQPELWRRLRERIGVPSPAERLAPACRALRADPGVLDLPPRLSLFGLTRLPPGQLEVVRALATGREVHMLVLHPSPGLWERVAGALPSTTAVPNRASDPTARLARNRLLASWGRESRELQLVVSTSAGDCVDHHHPLAEGPPATLLEALQAGIRADRPPPGAPLPDEPDRRLVLDPADASVQIHACHGRRRQVEVAREAILHRLAADPTLEPRDVIVMCPDIETFAPLIQASFGSAHDPADGDAAPAGTDLRVRLADRSLRRANPVLGVVAQLLELPSARLTASQVLDLADTEPVRRRFGWGEEELARIQDWIIDAGIHWGLDGPHRAGFKLAEVDAGTWAAGLRRLLLGVAIGDEDRRLYAGVLPVGDVEGDAITLAGELAELLDRLRSALDALTGPHTVAGWARALQAAADGLVAVPDRDAWQRYELSRLLDEVVAEAAGNAASARLALPEVRALLGARLEGRPTRANFRTGHLTVCTLHPMRSVPHRVVCLLGLDDGAFPRRTPRNGDDLLLAAPRVGDRDPRAEDRQLLLDALLAARDHLIVTYSGNDERTNAPRPPAVPVGELLDAIDATAVSAPGGRCQEARTQVLVSHPLQPFDPRNFASGELAGTGPWSFDEVSLEGARALGGPRLPRAPLLARPLPPPAAQALALADLIAFVERPVRAFLRQRLGVTVGLWDDEVADALPVQLDQLDRWGVGQRLLEGRLAGLDPRACVRAEIARGTLPPGALGEPVVRAVWPAAEAIVRHARAYGGSGVPRSLETNVFLPDGRRLVGTVSGVRDEILLAVGYSRLNARHRLAAWVRLLALSAAHPDVGFHAVTIGRAPSRSRDQVLIAEIPALGRDPQTRRERALNELAALADLRDRGLREPLPLPCQTAAAYAAAARSGDDPEAAAAGAWVSGWNYPREDREEDHRYAFGGELSLAELLSSAPAADERGPGWQPVQQSRLGALALRLWEPLLSRETVTPR
jgi:exodeoxyribonuclease V gamma subunit